MQKSGKLSYRGGVRGLMLLMKPARAQASSRPKPCASLKNAQQILPVLRSFLALVGRKHTVVRDQLFPQKPPGSCLLCLSRTWVQHSPTLTRRRSSFPTPSPSLVHTHPIERWYALPGFPRQCPLPLVCHHLPKGTKLELGRGAHLRAPSSTNHTAAASQPTG